MKRFPKRRTRRRRLKRPINVAASVLTTFALYCGIASIFESISGDFEWAAYYILAAIVLDTLDGTVARLTKSVSDFGKELDSLSDIVGFGVAPAVLLHIGYMQDMAEPNGTLVAIIYVIFGALRLARYNVFQAERQDYFVGLPIPGAAGTLASFSLFCQYFELQPPTWILICLSGALGLLMVTTIRYPRRALQVFKLQPRKAFQFLVLCVIGIAAFHYANEYSPSIVLFPLSLCYVGYGLMNEATNVFRRRQGTGEEQGGEKVAHQEGEAHIPK